MTREQQILDRLSQVKLIANAISRRLPANSVSLQDLISQGTLGLIAAVENQATMQRMLAAELREEAAILAHSNAIRKRQADMASQFRQDTTTLFK